MRPNPHIIVKDDDKAWRWTVEGEVECAQLDERGSPVAWVASTAGARQLAIVNLRLKYAHEGFDTDRDIAAWIRDEE